MIATDIGRGWISPEKAKQALEALQAVIRWGGIKSGMVDDAIAALEKELGE